MQLNITGQHIEITDALRNFIHTKFARLEHYFDRINQVHVILKVEKIAQIVEATMYVDGGELHATAESDNMYAAIDNLVDKLAKQLTRYKNKLKQY